MEGNRIPPEALTFFREQGKRGGLIGGKRKAENMTPSERSAMAKRMVVARIAKRSAAIASGELQPPTTKQRDPVHLVCRRCGHGWEQRGAKAPQRCHGCNSRQWHLTEQEAVTAKLHRQDERAKKKEAARQFEVEKRMFLDNVLAGRIGWSQDAVDLLNDWNCPELIPLLVK